MTLLFTSLIFGYGFCGEDRKSFYGSEKSNLISQILVALSEGEKDSRAFFFLGQVKLP